MQLSAEDRRGIEVCLRGGIQPVRTVRRALVLQQLDQGASCLQVARQVGVGINTAYQIRKRYEEGGLERALYDKPRPGAKPLLSPRQRQQVIAMVCSSPPTGQARWTVRMIAAESVRRGVVPRVGRETVRILLQNHQLQPWREKNVVRGGTGSRLRGEDGGCAGPL